MLRLTCKQVSELVSQSIDRRLSLHERLKLRLHLLICEACVRLKQQVEFLHVAAKDYVQRGVRAARQLELSPASRARIRETLHREQ